MRLASLALLVVALALVPVALVRGDDPAPAGPVGAERIDTLVKQLGADDFRVRESASRELEGIGEKARPALQKAKAESPSLEVRWRAEQLLRRLDGQGERSLDERGAGDGRPEEGAREDEGPATGARSMDRLRKMLEERLGREFGRQMGRDFGDELRKQMEQGGFGLTFPMFDAFGRRHVEVPGLALDLGPRGKAVLRVREENGSTEKTFEGKSLDDILEKNPALKDHAGMADLRKRTEALQTPPGFSLGGVFGQPGTTMFSSSSGVEIVQEPGKVKVTVRQKDEKGNVVPKTYEGTDLEQLKKDHPELREALGGFSLSFGPSFQAPQIFRDAFPHGLDGWVREGREAEDEDATPGQREEGQREEGQREEAPEAPRPTAEARFGVDVAPVEPILAYHLAIAEDRAALVMRVVPGSPAEAMGLQQHDVIVGVDGETPASFRATADALRAAARSKGPFALEVIRAGKRTTLSRP